MKTIPSSVLDIRMKPGMVAAMEIIFTVPGVGGIRLEDAYIVGAEQSENMNRAPMLMYV
jgi:Xaa-Pro aminopeptidase